MRIDVITIFPEYFAPLDVSLLGKARAQGVVTIAVHDLRAHATDRHHTVDDTPYGGGPGMVMKPEPWGAALDAVAAPGGAAPRLVVPTPSGRPFGQALAAEYATLPHLVLACGRYEGIDARVIDEAADVMTVDEISIGDYVLAGGEVAALAVIEAVTRLIPGVLGNADSVTDDSFAAGPMANLLEGPSYTKPPSWRGRDVPEVLRSGDHQAAARWRRDQALRRTAHNRPDLLANLATGELDDHDRQVLADAGFPVHPEGMAN